MESSFTIQGNSHSIREIIPFHSIQSHSSQLNSKFWGWYYVKFNTQTHLTFDYLNKFSSPLSVPISNLNVNKHPLQTLSSPLLKLLLRWVFLKSRVTRMFTLIFQGYFVTFTMQLQEVELLNFCILITEKTDILLLLFFLFGLCIFSHCFFVFFPVMKLVCWS